MFLSCMIFSAIPVVAATQPAAKVTGSENLTPGYTTLLLDYPKVQQQMHTAISQGNSAQWRNWMDAGVRKNETLYWWLLADWLWSTGKKDDAYKALVQSFVFMKVEMVGCGISPGEITDTTNSLLKNYSYILTNSVSQDTIKSSVLEAITRTENHLNRGLLLSEMSCQFVEAQKKSKTVTLNAVPKDQRAFQRKMMMQRTALAGLKRDMSYSRMWNYSDADLLWKSQSVQQY